MEDIINNYDITKLNIFIINLERSNDRLEKIKLVFSHPNINIIRVPAIEKEIGWQGLYFTNKLLLETIHKSNINDNILVIEDDCELVNDINLFYDKIMRIKKWLENSNIEWDIFNPGYHVKKAEEQFKIDNITILGKTEKIYFLDINNINWKSTHMIFYNNKNIHKIVNSNIMMTWDNFLHDYKTVFSYPLLAIQKENFSTIDKKVVRYDKLYNKTICYLKKIILEKINHN